MRVVSVQLTKLSERRARERTKRAMADYAERHPGETRKHPAVTRDRSPQIQSTLKVSVAGAVIDYERGLGVTHRATAERDRRRGRASREDL